MRWGKLFGSQAESFPVWAALCTTRADGSNPKYPANAKHAIMAMVRAAEPQAESGIHALLQSNGWREPTIQKLKMLDQPFQSDDPIMVACHKGAINENGGIVVYSDPIEDT